MDRVRYLIGIVTLALAVAGGWFLLNLLGDEDKSRFFRLHLEFRSVRGLLPGADVKYRGVLVGSVRRVDLSEDGKKGIATVVLNPGKEPLARTNSKFWVVTPRFGGITSGASGLETLVRDAYLSCFTPEPWGPQLANGSSVVGLEAPYEDAGEPIGEHVKRGDLLMTLLVPENHGLDRGSPVLFRGVRTGTVRRVDLANDGSHVRLELRIDRRYRRTVTDKTLFWVARPRLSGSIMSAISLEDLSALLSPFVSYHTEPGAGLPVPDEYVVAAEVARPDLELPKVDSTQHRPVVAEPVRKAESIQLVRVIYEATEEDWLSPNDHLHREGTGVLFEDPEGRPLVLTARSLCDGNYFDRDAFGGDPDIVGEGISIVLADGTVVRALRTWVATTGADLALLTVDLDTVDREDLAPTPLRFFAFEGGANGVNGNDGKDEHGGKDLRVRSLDSDQELVEEALPEALGSPEERGAVVLSQGRIVGILGQRAGTDEQLVLLPLADVPEALRPVR